ncbi:MAG: hypothetical protein AB1465_07175 [Patescibacteria group bacterium]
MTFFVMIFWPAYKLHLGVVLGATLEIAVAWQFTACWHNLSLFQYILPP